MSACDSHVTLHLLAAIGLLSCAATRAASCSTALQPQVPGTVHVEDTTQFEPTTWAWLVTRTPDGPRKLTAPFLEIQTLHEGTWLHVGGVSTDPARKALPTATVCREPSTPIQLEARREHRSIHELRDYSVIGWSGRYRARARWSVQVGPHQFDPQWTEWVEFQVKPAGPEGKALAEARQQNSPLWQEYQGFVGLPALTTSPLWTDWRDRSSGVGPAFSAMAASGGCGLLHPVALPRRIRLGVEARLLALRIEEARTQPDGERRTALAPLLARVEQLQKAVSDQDVDAPLRLAARVLEIACHRGLAITIAATRRLPHCAATPLSSACGWNNRSGQCRKCPRARGCCSRDSGRRASHRTRDSDHPGHEPHQA